MEKHSETSFLSTLRKDKGQRINSPAPDQVRAVAYGPGHEAIPLSGFMIHWEGMNPSQ